MTLTLLCYGARESHRAQQSITFLNETLYLEPVCVEWPITRMEINILNSGEKQTITSSCEGWPPCYFRACHPYRLRCEKYLPKEVQYFEYCPDSCKHPKASHHSDYTDKKNKLQLYQPHENKKGFLINLPRLSLKELLKIPERDY